MQRLFAITVATAAVCAAITFNVSAQETPYKLGTTVPASVTLTDQSGKVHTLSQYRGKPVVLEWTNPGCPFVKKHYASGNMQKLQADAIKKGAAWITVNSSAPGKQGYLDPKTAAADVKKAGYNSTFVALDSAGTLGKAFGAEATPHMYVLDAKGKLVYMGAIDSIPSFSADDVTKADNYVVKALDEVLAGTPVTTAQTKAYGCSVKY
ncbi:MAG: redoxin domain-containing protein [Alphaproteobacteria bacterium]|nr:MAG: redoxin domain-containing protein [Alphaproteobacteria bacterium]